MASASAWLPGRPSSRLLTDLAGDRPLTMPEGFILDSALAARHGLLGLIAHCGDERLAAAARLPYFRLKARQQVMSAHLRRLLEKLDQASIPAAVLKGPALAIKYRVAEHRTFTDLDLLVPPAHLDSCLDLLGMDQAVEAVPPQRAQADKRDIVLVDPSGLRFSLDLHWDLFSYHQLGGRAEAATETSWAVARRVEDEIGPRWVLPAETEITFLCAHALLDHRFRLILFRDLVELAISPVAWPSVIEFAGRFGLAGTTYLALLIAARSLDAKIPPAVLAELRPRGTALRAAEALLPRTDLVHFDGHRPHPLNLALVLMHDDWRQRVYLAFRAPLALPAWRQRVSEAKPSPWRAVSQPAPRLTILVASTQRRGAEVFGERLAGGLVKCGWTVDLVALGSGPEGAPTVAAVALSSKKRVELGRLDWETVLSLRRHLRRAKTEIVLAFGSSTLQYGVASARLMSNRPGLAYASIGEPLYWARQPHQRLAYRALLFLVDEVLAVSTPTAQQLVSGLGISPKKVRVVHTGVPGELLAISRSEAEDNLRILFLGGLTMEKDPLMAIEVFSRLVATVPARLRLVGGGPLEGAIRQRIAEAGLRDWIDLTGSVDEVAPHLAWAEVLLMTSRTEGLPAAPIEAAAAGIPSVAFDVGGVAETIIDGVTGGLIGPGDMAAMVDALAFYAQNPTDRQAAGAAGRDLVIDRFTMDHSVQQHDAALRDLLTRRRPPL